MKSKTKKVILGLIATLATTATIALGAWILSTNSRGNVLSIKSKHLSISTNGGVDFDIQAPAMFDQEIDTSLGAQVLAKNFYLKSTKTGVTNLELSVENLVRTKNGEEWDLVACPLTNSNDPANHMQVRFDGVRVADINDLELTPHAFTFDDPDLDKVTTEYVFDVYMTTSFEDNDCGNGAEVFWDFVILDVTP